MYKLFLKRILDFWISLLLLIIVSPILLIVTIWLTVANNKASNNSPFGRWRGDRELSSAFFLQERPGKDAKIFKVIKFKTMTDERDEDGQLLPDSQRLTKVGRFVRSTSIDELPQLINVLKGDMALIGPRPLLVQYLPLYNKEQARRHEVRPGISGWAQVHGRNHCKLSKKFEMDVWYVDHCTLMTDLRIIWLTVKNVLKRSDIGEGAGDMKEVDDLHFAERLKVIREAGKTV
jgi:lipopolysaccharide/colanic/teichoic acid biosynthesis glycosyltransferase